MNAKAALHLVILTRDNKASPIITVTERNDHPAASPPEGPGPVIRRGECAFTRVWCHASVVVTSYVLADSPPRATRAGCPIMRHVTCDCNDGDRVKDFRGSGQSIARIRTTSTAMVPTGAAHIWTLYKVNQNYSSRFHSSPKGGFVTLPSATKTTRTLPVLIDYTFMKYRSQMVLL